MGRFFDFSRTSGGRKPLGLYAIFAPAVTVVAMSCGLTAAAFAEEAKPIPPPSQDMPLASQPSLDRAVLAGAASGVSRRSSSTSTA